MKTFGLHWFWMKAVMKRAKPAETGELVKELRDRMDASKETLAGQIGSSVTSVSRWESGGRIAGRYLAELATLSAEYEFGKGASEFARLRSEEIARSVGDNRSTRRIPSWELQNIRDTLGLAIHELDAVGDTEKVRALRLRLKYIDECLSPWTKTRWSTVISPSGEGELEITNSLRERK